MKVLEEANKAIELVLEDRTLLKNIAKMMRLFFDELIRVGFTEDQASVIVANYKP